MILDLRETMNDITSYVRAHLLDGMNCGHYGVLHLLIIELRSITMDTVEGSVHVLDLRDQFF